MQSRRTDCTENLFFCKIRFSLHCLRPGPAAIAYKASLNSFWKLSPSFALGEPYPTHDGVGPHLQRIVVSFMKYVDYT